MFTKMDKRLKYGLILGVILALVVATGALAAVWTDKPDYEPGSIVTISGDNSNGAGYVPGNTVNVEVAGGNGWSSSCSATIDEYGKWSCYVTLDSDPNIAVGSYTYTATSIDEDGNPINETGTFTDAIQTNTTVTSSSNPSTFGGSVTFTATVKANTNAVTDGQVEFGTGNNCEGDFTILQGAQNVDSNGIVTYTTSGLSVGTTTIRACYLGYGSGASAYSKSNGTVIQTVNAPSDTTPPTVNVSFPAPDGNNGWFKTSPVVGSISATDPSNVTAISCTGASVGTIAGLGTTSASAPLTVSGDGTHNISCTATDGAGNTGAASGSSNTATLKIDATAPSVTVTPDRASDHNGWYNAPVTFDTAGTDVTSGVSDANCTADQIYSGPDGAGLTLSGSCTDNAGNVNSGTSAAFDFDDTNPVVTVTPDRGPDHNGWYNASVIFDIAGTDATSGVLDSNCTADQTYSGPDGTELSVNGSCTDGAGNVGNGTSADFDFDATNPSVTVTPDRAPDHNGWYNAPVTFDTDGTDAPSGIASCDLDQTYSGPDGTGLMVSGSCTDNAGNTASADSTDFDFDDTNPSVTVTPDRTPDHNGWYNAPVIFDTAGADTTSGVSDANCSADQTYNGPDGDGLTVNGSCTDGAGNVGDGTSAAFDYDATPPTLSPTVSPNPVVLNGSASATSNASDAITGIDTEGCDPVNTGSVGSHSVSCSATDNAGNTTTAAAAYSVQYASGGLCYGAPGHTILQPINADGTSVFKQKSTVPAKFRVCDAFGNSIGAEGVVLSFKVISIAGAPPSPVNETVVSTTPDTAFRWSPTDQLWIFNINTKSSSIAKYTYRIELNDGTEIIFSFSLK